MTADSLPSDEQVCVLPASEEGSLSHKLERLQDDQLIAASTKLDQHRYKTDYIVPGMHCVGCIRKLETELAQLEGVEHVRANLSMKTVSVIWDDELIRPAKVSSAIDGCGFDHHLAEFEGESTEASETRSLLLAMAVAGFAAANIMLLSVSVWSGADDATARLFHLISGLIAIPVVFYSGRPFFRSALRSLSVGRLNMDVPISLAVLLALGLSIYESMIGGGDSYFDASVMLLFFLLIGRYLDFLMRGRARQAVEQLSNLSSKNGVVVEPSGDVSVVVLKDIVPGMILRVYPGERFPVNGKIISGEGLLDRAHITGESDCVHVKEGDLIEAGALNLRHTLDMEATSTSEDSFLAEMKSMMEAAERGRGSYTRIADRMARIYAPAVHLFALVAFVGWMFWTGGDWHVSLLTAITVLIITCPCALGLAVPVTHVIGAHRLMQAGILLRNGTALERLAEVDHVVFDKTGTLTREERSVGKSSSLDPQEASLLKALASSSSHPISRALNRFLNVRVAQDVAGFREEPGYGVEARWQDRLIRFGKAEWVREISGHGHNMAEHASVGFSVEGGVLHFFELDDELRLDARETVAKLTQAGYPVEILSGDKQVNVAVIADQLGIKIVSAEKTPFDKLSHLEAIRREGRKPLMVGDGVNDAPALMAGHASMVPASACDVGRHAADFVLTQQSLLSIPFAIKTARRVDQIVRQNFGLAIAYNCIAVPLAMAGYVTPLVAAIAMSLSSVVVVANSFRVYLVGDIAPSPAVQLGSLPDETPIRSAA